MLASFKPRPLKNLFTANGCWAGLVEAGGLRDIEVESVSKMLACGTSILGVKHYRCGNERCPHVKYLCNTCHCQAYPSCGKKATDQWIAAQQHRLPDCMAPPGVHAARHAVAVALSQPRSTRCAVPLGGGVGAHYL